MFRVGTSVAALFLAGGCILRPDPFTCANDAACVQGGEQGICIDGACAFGDATTGPGSETGSESTAGPVEDPCPTCLYLSPDGNDGNIGNRGAPWRTFGHAFEQMAPGRTLVLLDGTYDVAGSGAFDARCGANAPVGPIEVRAENQRAATVVGDPAVRLEGCTDWNITDIRADGELRVTNGFETEVSGALVSGSVVVEASEAILITDSEAYGFDAVGFSVDASRDVTLRRCYASSDADAAFDIVGTIGVRVENCVGENTVFGVRINGGEIDGQTAGRNNTVVGTIVIGNRTGIAVREKSVLGNVGETRILHTLALRSTEAGIAAQASADTDVRHATVVTAAEAMSGIVGGDSQETCADDSMFCSLHVVNSVALGGEQGINIKKQDETLVEYCNAVGHSESNNYRIDSSVSDPIDDAVGAVQNSLAVDAGLGLDICEVVVLASSPLSAAGEGGADIGADLAFRFEGSDAPSDEPLWGADQTFPCGAVVAGVNDRAGGSCFDLHERVAVEGCNL